jgi:hypothetical protein
MSQSRPATFLRRSPSRCALVLGVLTMGLTVGPTVGSTASAATPRSPQLWSACLGKDVTSARIITTNRGHRTQSKEVAAAKAKEIFRDACEVVRGSPPVAGVGNCPSGGGGNTYDITFFTRRRKSLATITWNDGGCIFPVMTVGTTKKMAFAAGAAAWPQEHMQNAVTAALRHR